MLRFQSIVKMIALYKQISHTQIAKHHLTHKHKTRSHRQQHNTKPSVTLNACMCNVWHPGTSSRGELGPPRTGLLGLAESIQRKAASCGLKEGKVPQARSKGGEFTNPSSLHFRLWDPKVKVQREPLARRPSKEDKACFIKKKIIEVVPKSDFID